MDIEQTLPFYRKVGKALQQGWGRLFPVALDTLTTRFLLLFVFLLAIPLGTLIIFTVSLLAKHMDDTADSQMHLSQNLFHNALIDSQETLGLMAERLDQPTRPGQTGRCLNRKRLLCITIEPAQNQIRFSTGKQFALSRFRTLYADLELSYGQNLEKRLFTARVQNTLYLLQKSDYLPATGAEFLYGLPLDNAFLNQIYQGQPGLQTKIWLLSKDTRNNALSLLASSNAVPVELSDATLLRLLAQSNPDKQPNFTMEINQLPYQISQESLYGLDHQKIARVVHILPLSQNRLLLNQYYLGIYLIGVASLLFSVLLAMVAGRTITQPLLKLINQVNLLSRESVMKENDQVPMKGIYEIRQLGEAFNRMILRLRQEHKMKDEFVATLTHDLKVPLLAEKQTLLYFKKEAYGPINAEQAEVLDVLHSSNRSCLTLVNGLLEVYRYDSGEVSLMQETFNLPRLMDDAVTELKSLALEKMIELQVKYELGDQSEQALVYADKLEIKRVLHNLISNAITNTPVHGKIECRITDAAHYGNETVYKVSTFQYTTLKHPAQLTDRLLVVIQDSGIGFSNDDLPYLFKQFAASKGRNPMSTGLGLFNSAQVIQAHHNILWVESSEGEGSAVSFTLPRNKKTAQDRRVFRDRRKRP